MPERACGTSRCCSAWRYPFTVGRAKYPGIIRSTTPAWIRLMQVLLACRHHGRCWRAQQLHEVLVTSFGLSDKCYGLEPIGATTAKDARPRAARTRRQSICLPPHRQGVKVALLFVSSDRAYTGPLANSLFTTARRQLPARQQTRKGHAQSRRLHTPSHSTLEAT